LKPSRLTPQVIDLLYKSPYTDDFSSQTIIVAPRRHYADRKRGVSTRLEQNVSSFGPSRGVRPGAITTGNLIGAAAPNEFVLLTARIIEGAGFFATVPAIPACLRGSSQSTGEIFVMAMWSARDRTCVALCGGAAGHAKPAGGAARDRLVQQASNPGQFTGPLVLGIWVQQLGWRAAPAIVAPASPFRHPVAFMTRGAMYCVPGLARPTGGATSRFVGSLAVEGEAGSSAKTTFRNRLRWPLELDSSSQLIRLWKGISP